MQDKKVDELLKQQVLEIMNEEQNTVAEPEQPVRPIPNKDNKNNKAYKQKRKKKHRFLKGLCITVMFLLVVVLLIIGTKPGRNSLYRAASNFVFGNVQNEEIETSAEDRQHAPGARHEKYVMNYLIFGIEEIGGARNTDSMMIASINTKDDTVKLTSLLRDSYVDIPGYKANKLNSTYSKGGADLLIETVEKNYKIRIDGYASVDFKSFEKIVDLLGGVTIELGEKEAKYLNKTNYISKKTNRNVKPGINKLNGNQAMGYCRVRKVETLGGVNNDYGRVIRQQRVLKAMFESYTSMKNVVRILPITKECLGYVTTDLSQEQIEKAMEAVVENKITIMDTFRIPVDGTFESPKKYNGIGYPILLDWEKNRIELYKYVFNDTEKEAVEAMASPK
jgi:LCP family protein required for cell wall assembly